MNNGYQIFGALLVCLGIFIGVCAIISSGTYADVEIAYKHGIIIGVAISMCSIGGLLSSGKLNQENRNQENRNRPF